MGSGAEAIPGFHHWADNRRQHRIAPIIAFLARLWLAWLLLQISSGASWLARKAVPTA
jgi:hypothetical protein